MNEQATGPAAAGSGAGVHESIPDRILETVQAGGPVVVLLVAMSILVVAVLLLKLWQFSQIRVGRRVQGQEAVRLFRAGRTGDALERAQQMRGPVGEVLARVMRGKQRGVSESKIREEVLRYGNEVLESLRGGFRILEVTATLAPLLGLFGTVLGMIEAFRQLEAAGSQVNPAILSGGIWQALLTTAVGLAVAIPTIAILNGLERHVDSLAHDMDNLVTQIFTEDLSAGGVQTKTDRDGWTGISVPAG